MKKKLWLVMALGLALTAAGLAGCDVGSPRSGATIAGSIFNTQNTGIWVSGQGKVTAVPDVAILNLGVQAQAATVAQAQGQAAAAMNAVVGALRASGVAEKDIQTQNFNIQQLARYDDKTQQQVIIGYVVNNTVTAKVRKVDSAGPVIDAVARAGGDNTRINGITLTVDDPSRFETEARQKAMADARAKAEQLAKAAGVRLGKPLYINENGGFVPIKSIGMAAPAPSLPATTPISPGETEITLTVQVTYAID